MIPFVPWGSQCTPSAAVCSTGAMTSLTLEFLQDLLREDYPDVTIQQFQGAPGSKRGDNYTSMVYRITLKGVRKLTEPDGSCESEEPWEGSIIYKCLPESIVRREAFKSDELFCNEVAFYTKIWPALDRFQAQWDVSEPFKCIPKCYLAQNDAVILKDLKELGFSMPDRRQGLSIEQCYYALKKLSHFHALSLAMKSYDPEAFFELVEDGVSEVFFLPENVDYYKTYYGEATRNAISLVEEELKDAEDKDLYLDKLRNFCNLDTFFQTMMEMVAPREPLAVVCHGDCWTNNFLFRYDSGEIAEMYMVDFQVARYASPALDLAYVTYICLGREQRAAHLPALLQHYADELHRRLQEMPGARCLDKVALDAMLQEEFRRSSQFGLGIALDMYHIMTCDSDEAPNLYQPEESEAPESHDGTNIKPVVTTNTACRKKMADLVIELVDGGLL